MKKNNREDTNFDAPDDWQFVGQPFYVQFDLLEVFHALEKYIGEGAHRAWFRDGDAKRDANGCISIRAGSSFKAQWIRENYATVLETLDGNPVRVFAEGNQFHPVPTESAWWQTHDIKTGSTVASPRDIAAERSEIERQLAAGVDPFSMVNLSGIGKAWV